ncbi:MAG: DUF6789 family protein [Myxococcota bacterium]
MNGAQVDRVRGAGAGAIGGLVGGVVLWAFLLFATALRGQDVWMVFKGAATPLLGERAGEPGFDFLAVFLGAGVHFLVSVGWGALFGIFFAGLTRGATLAAGVLWGVVVWLVMFYVVLPLVGMGQVSRQVPIGFAVLEHVLFGVVVALVFVPFQRTLRRQVPPRPPLPRPEERPVTP